MNLIRRIQLALVTAPIVAILLLPEVCAGQPSGVVNANDSGPGSLRDAIANAAATDFISFEQSLSGQTITLTTGEIAVNKNLTIDGSGLSRGLQISGNNNSRI